MSNKDYRELQLSSFQLAFIFIAVLILGLVIFILGVSVGKKQAQIVADSGIAPKKKPAKIEVKKPAEAEIPKDLIRKELESHKKITEEVQKPIVPKPTAPTKNLWYIQVGAFSNKNSAISLADQFKKEGYPSLVLEPFSTDRRPLYRLRIGGYKTKEEAESVKAKLKPTKKKKDYFIIKD